MYKFDAGSGLESVLSAESMIAINWILTVFHRETIWSGHTTGGS